MANIKIANLILLKLLKSAPPEFKSRAPSFRRELLRRNSREPESDATPVVAAPKE